MAEAAASNASGFWGWAKRRFAGIGRMFARAVSRSRELKGGVAEDTRTGHGRTAEGRGSAAKKEINHPVVSDLRWRAACEILESLGALTLPKQLRAHVDAVGDPGLAVEMLVEDLGCDLERLKDGDPEEQDVFLERLELLVSLDRVLESAPDHLKELVVRLFYSGELGRLRELAEIRRDLQTTLSLCDDVRKQRAMASMERLRKDVAEALDHVETVEKAFASEALRKAAGYMRIADRLAAETTRWNTTLKEARYIWPLNWRAPKHPKRVALEALDRRGMAYVASLVATENLQIDAAKRTLTAFERAIAELEELLKQAHAEALRGHQRAEAGARLGGAPQAHDSVHVWLKDLGLHPGKQPTPAELNAAYRLVMKQVYPLVNKGDRRAEEAVKRINTSRDKLKALFRYT